MRIDIGQWHIRNYRPADADAVARYAGNPNVWRNLRDAHPYTVPAATAWIRHSLRQRPETNFAIASEEVSHRLAGRRSPRFRRNRLLVGRTLLGTGHRHGGPARPHRVRFHRA